MTTKTVRLLMRQVSRTDGLVSRTDLSELQNRLALTVLFSVTSRTRWPPNDPWSAGGIGMLLALCGPPVVAMLSTETLLLSPFRDRVPRAVSVVRAVRRRMSVRVRPVRPPVTCFPRGNALDRSGKWWVKRRPACLGTLGPSNGPPGPEA